MFFMAQQTAVHQSSGHTLPQVINFAISDRLSENSNLVRIAATSTQRSVIQVKHRVSTFEACK